MVAPTLRFSRFSNSSTLINLWNSKIRLSVDHNDANGALSLFCQMKHNSLQPTNLTFPFICKACAKLSIPEYSQIIHTHIVKSPFNLDVFVQTAMLDMFVKCGQLQFAYNLFEKMPQRNVASWNVMLTGFSQMGSVDRFLCTLLEMRFGGTSLDSVTVMGVSRMTSCVKNLEWAKGVHAFGIRIGVDSEVTVANTWISMYAKCGDLGSAELVFCEIGGCLRSMVSWNSMIAGYGNFEKYFEALLTYKLMLHDGFRPDVSTIVTLLSACAHGAAMFQGMLIHSHGIRVGCDSDICVVNALISMYSKCVDVDSARRLFDCMHDRSCVSWNAMISGYAEKGDMDEALTLFNTMQTTGEKPDLVTVLSLISGCGRCGLLEFGKWIDSYSHSSGLKDVVVCNALIDMYAKCGSLSYARELFHVMVDRTVVSWTAMISACAVNGSFEEALDLFHQLVESGMKPNHITFLAVLQACSHAGFLKKGWESLNMMTRVYGINPGLDHYSCMVDILGRMGKVKEAFAFIQDMPLTPDAAIWNALLGACKIHKNIEIGEYAARHLFEMEPHVAVPYVQMANLYASAGRWDGVARIRTMMKCNKVQKSPGQSIVEINGKTRAFSVEDRDHFDGQLIYAALESDFALEERRIFTRRSIGIRLLSPFKISQLLINPCNCNCFSRIRETLNQGDVMPQRLRIHVCFRIR